jgi:hypothetical protein
MEEILMKRFALVLAAAVLGMGCGGGSNPSAPPVLGSANVYWDFVRFAPSQPAPHTILYDSTFAGAVNGACSESAVDFVTVDSAVGQTSVSCVYGPSHAQGVGIDGLPAGANDIRVRGWRHIGPNDIAVYDETFVVNVLANGLDNHFLDVNAVAANIDLSTYLAFGAGPTDYASCAAATPASSIYPPNLHFEIREPVFKLLVEGGTVGCGDPLPAALFSGLLDLDDFKVRVQGLRVEDDALVLDSCWVDLAHFGAQGFAPTALTNPVPTCTPL